MINDIRVAEALKNNFSREDVLYVERKNRGGGNGAKGIRYEDLFMAFKVAELAAGMVDVLDAEWAHISGQTQGFVDDVRISCSSSTEYFQLKNQVAVSWVAGAHTIARDFELQYCLSGCLKEPAPTTTLVVSGVPLQLTLAKTVPIEIQPHSTAIYFPWLETANRVVVEDAVGIQASLRKLANVQNPTLDVLAGVLGVLLMACIEHPEGASVKELIDCVSRMFPGQIRVFPTDDRWELHLQPAFKKILADIHGLKYGSDRGYFYWEAYGTAGVFGENCLSAEFNAFQQNVIQEIPKTFEEFERLLP